MSARQQLADQVLITAGVVVAMTGSGDPSLKTYLHTLTSCLPDTSDNNPALEGVRGAALQIVRAKSAAEVDLAVGRLRHAIRSYFGISMGKRHDEWRSEVLKP